jgi:hypothetical protein
LKAFLGHFDTKPDININRFLAVLLCSEDVELPCLDSQLATIAVIETSIKAAPISYFTQGTQLNIWYP